MADWGLLWKFQSTVELPVCRATLEHSEQSSYGEFLIERVSIKKNLRKFLVCIFKLAECESEVQNLKRDLTKHQSLGELLKIALKFHLNDLNSFSHSQLHSFRRTPGDDPDEISSHCNCSANEIIGIVWRGEIGKVNEKQRNIWRQR